MMIAAFVLAICNLLKAEDKVTISDFKISAGETKEVSITLNNDAAYVAFQFDLYLPNGVTIEAYSADRSRIPESTTLNMTQLADGSYRFLSAAMGGEQIVGKSGSIVSLTVKASEGLVPGEVYGYFRKVKLAKADATGPTYADMSFPITIVGPVNGISLDKSEVVVKKNKTVTLKATVSPETLEDKSVIWKSSDTKIATVTSSGKVKGVKTGIATITCTSVATGAKATCKVTVATITLDQTNVVIGKNKTVTLTPTVYPTTLTDKSVKWKSSDKTIATVTSSGTVKGVKTGIATITCTSVATGLSTTCTVTVGTITLDQTNVVVKKNKTVTLTPTVYPLTLEDKSVTWKSSDKTIATVSSSGKVKGVKTGTVTITCTSVATGLSTTCTVTVGTITLDKTSVTVKKNKTVKLTPTVYPTTLEDKSVKWESSDKTIATVTSTGTVKGVKTGTVTITCTSVATGLSATCTVIVGTITLNKSEVTVKKGMTVTLTPTVYPTTLEDKSVTWKSSDETIATVTSDGIVEGIKAGTATITCTSVATGLSTTCKVTVTASSNARTLDGDDADVTGIETIDENPAIKEPVDVYDLGGRQVLKRVTSLDGLPAGVYIVNGKKMLKK